MNEAGIVLYKYTQSENLDSTLFGGLMSAINSFATKVAKSSLESIELHDYRYYILIFNNCKFIVNSSKNQKPKKVKEEIKKIVKAFFDNYSIEDIQNWDGRKSYFDEFSSKLEEEFLGALKRFENELW